MPKRASSVSGAHSGRVAIHTRRAATSWFGRGVLTRWNTTASR